MTFLNPQFLWGLLALLPLGAAYFLKVKPKRHSTNAWFLWEKVFEEKNSSSLFSKLRSFLSLLLMCLVVMLISVGLSGPQFGGKDSRDVFLVIDRSVSMKALDGGKVRLAVAKDKARQAINALSPGQRASVVTLDNELNYVTHLTSNLSSLHDAVDSIEPSLLSDSREAAEALTQMVSDESIDDRACRVMLFSDGCNYLSKFKNSAVEVFNVGNGDAFDNVGIVASDIQPVLGGESAKAMVKLWNSSSKEVTVELEFFHVDSDEIVELLEVKLKPGENEPIFVDLQDAPRGRWVIKVLREDQLDDDNEAFLMLHPLPSLGVTIPKENNYFFQRCIEAFSKTTGSLRVVKGDDADIRIFSGAVPSEVTGDLLVFSPQGESELWSDLGEEFAVGVVMVEEEKHPMLKHFDENSFSFSGARRIKAPEGAKVIVRSDDGTPLIYQVNAANSATVVVNLNPELDDFFISTSFVSMIYDAAMYLSGTQTEKNAGYAVGSNMILDVDVNLQTPLGGKLQVEAGELFWVNQVGFFSGQIGRDQSSIAVSLLSPKESRLSRDKKSVAELNFEGGYPISFWLLVFAMIILVMESLLYHRRKAE